MTRVLSLSKLHHLINVAALAVCVVMFPEPAAAQLPPDLVAKIETYKTKLQEWAAQPAIVAAVKESNAAGGMISGMTNAKWDELAENDAAVLGFQHSAAGTLLTRFEEDTGISKLFLRDANGNLVASSKTKPLVYNNKSKPPFINGMKGPWAASEIKPDPATQIKGVHISVPVMDGATSIGVLHSSVVAP